MLLWLRGMVDSCSALEANYHAGEFLKQAPKHPDQPKAATDDYTEARDNALLQAAAPVDRGKKNGMFRRCLWWCRSAARVHLERWEQDNWSPQKYTAGFIRCAREVPTLSEKKNVRIFS